MPNRIIKESIRTSKSVNALPDFLFRVWVYLITYVDDYGRGSADPQLLRGFLLPRKRVTESQIREALAGLADAGLIILYEDDGEAYQYFPKWEDHQRIRQKVSRFPAPPPIAADCGEQRPESNPIQSNPNPESESESNPILGCDARAREPADETGTGEGKQEETPENDNRWEEFWNAYPRKVGGSIDNACREYQAAVSGGTDPELLIRKARELEETTPPDRMRYIPAAEKWLRNRGWLQEAQDRGARNAGADAEPARKPKQFTTAAEYRPEAKIDAEQLEKVKSLLLGNGAGGPDPGEG